MLPSPLRFTMRPWWSAMVGSMRSLRRALSRASVRSSSERRVGSGHTGFPSYEKIAEAADWARSTIAEAIRPSRTRGSSHGCPDQAGQGGLARSVRRRPRMVLAVAEDVVCAMGVGVSFLRSTYLGEPAAEGAFPLRTRSHSAARASSGSGRAENAAIASAAFAACFASGALSLWPGRDYF
jgi:hypothetical protein